MGDHLLDFHEFSHIFPLKKGRRMRRNVLQVDEFIDKRFSIFSVCYQTLT